MGFVWSQHLRDTYLFRDLFNSCSRKKAVVNLALPMTITGIIDNP